MCYSVFFFMKSVFKSLVCFALSSLFLSVYSCNYVTLFSEVLKNLAIFHFLQVTFGSFSNTLKYFQKSFAIFSFKI